MSTGEGSRSRGRFRISDDSVTRAAAGAAGIFVAFAGVQGALAAGAPLGAHVWGGTQDRVLPPEMRIAAAGAAVTLMAMAGVVVRRAGIVGRPARWLGPATWGIAGYLALNTLGNFASASAVERIAFTPLTAVASALTGFVAYRTGRSSKTR
ncbi:MAG: hypothetical protein R2710_31450 [Acidimicrobiales bacterium]